MAIGFLGGDLRRRRRIPADLPPTLPGAPQNLVVYNPTPVGPNNFAALASWNAGSNGNTPITNYVVQYSTDQSNWTSVNAGTQQSVSIEGLVSNTQYYFRVAAVNVVGQGPFTGVVAATTGSYVGKGAAYIGFGASTGSYRSEQWVTDFLWSSDFNTVTMNDLLNNSNLIGSTVKLGNEYRFTDTSSGGVGNLFYNIPVFITDTNGNLINWSVRYTLSMGGQLAGDHADGMTFIVQSNNVNQGGSGVGLGYGAQGQQPGIPNSFALEYDTFQNNIVDPNNNHIGVDVNGSVDSLQTANPAFSMWKPTAKSAGGGAPTYCWADYNGSTQQLSMFVSTTNVKPASPLLTQVLDIRNYVVLV